MDDDYAEYGYDDPADPLKVTAAHEYNHVVQYAYDVLQDKWMFESTATWMEEKVFPEVDDYHQYVVPWAQLSAMPITRFDRQDGDKVYGSAVFNRWLDDEYDESIVRRAWELSINQGSFAPGAYDKAIREYHGPGFSYELASFAASTAEWKVPGGRRPRGARSSRTSSAARRDAAGGQLGGERRARPHGLRAVRCRADERAEAPAGGHAARGHRGRRDAGRPQGRHDLEDHRGRDPQGGKATVVLNDPGSYERITAVVVNGSYEKAGWNGTDWNWTRDQQAVAVAASAVTGGGGTPDPGSRTPAAARAAAARGPAARGPAAAAAGARARCSASSSAGRPSSRRPRS